MNNGSDLAYTPGLSAPEKVYIKIFGAPINGLRIRIRRIMPQIKGTPARILDAGCGRGVFSMLLARKFPNADVLGVDLDAEQLEINTQIANIANYPNLKFSVQDVALLSYKEEFDIVLSVDNIEHIEDDQKAINTLSSALKPGGFLYLHIPAYERRWFFFNFRTNFDVPGHYRPGYTLNSICHMVSAAKLNIVQADYTYGWLENISNNISYFITKAEAKNRLVYAMVFPILNFIAWLGRNTKPKKGAGILVVAQKKRI